MMTDRGGTGRAGSFRITVCAVCEAGGCGGFTGARERDDRPNRLQERRQVKQRRNHRRIKVQCRRSQPGVLLPLQHPLPAEQPHPLLRRLGQKPLPGPHGGWGVFMTEVPWKLLRCHMEYVAQQGVEVRDVGGAGAARREAELVAEDTEATANRRIGMGTLSSVLDGGEGGGSSENRDLRPRTTRAPNPGGS